jgi:hypothetical protein
MYLLQDTKNYLEEQLYPFTITHLIIFTIITVIGYYLTDYLMHFRLLKWIYIGTLIVLIANLYKQGDDKKAAKDIFKLATI